VNSSRLYYQKPQRAYLRLEVLNLTLEPRTHRCNTWCHPCIFGVASIVHPRRSWQDASNGTSILKAVKSGYRAIKVLSELPYQCLTITNHPRSLIALNSSATLFLFMPSLGATSSIACLPSRCFNKMGQLSLSSFPVMPSIPPS
jgi:hypothetical protein